MILSIVAVVSLILVLIVVLHIQSEFKDWDHGDSDDIPDDALTINPYNGLPRRVEEIRHDPYGVFVTPSNGDMV